jgi:hypothetical protein
MSKNNSDLSGLAGVLSSMQALSKAISANFQLQEAASSMLEIRQQLIKTFEPILQSQMQTSEMLKGLSVSIDNIAQSLLPNFRLEIENFISPALKDFFENFRLLPEQTQVALLTLGNHGWFFDLEMPLPFLWELENALNEGDINEAEAALADYFRKNLETIENRFVTKFPHRAKIINSAFNAHKRGEYELSIPIFLAQTDGICYEVINQHLFMRVRGEKKPSTAIYVDSFASDTFRHALLSPLSQPLPISASKNERSETFNELNRHQVMHGESWDYGTEVNGLKSISLLNYVAQVLRLDDENET